MSETEKREGLTRKQLLGAGAGVAAGALLGQGAVERALGAGKGGQGAAGMNVILFLTDQERAIQHFPPNWQRENLPGMRRLRRHGVSFESATCNACMCSPSRSTLLTGNFPAQHGVKYTLEEEMSAANGNPQVELPLPAQMANLATMMQAAGYATVYKGKWHCSKPEVKEEDLPSDLERYGFFRWNPPDAGANQNPPEAGGGYVDNDGRFVDSKGEAKAGAEGALEYLGSSEARERPFFMVISLVNPHDVLFYPSKNFSKSGYDETWLEGDMKVPETFEEDLSSKPKAQEQFKRIMGLTGEPKGRAQARKYLNFYGNLMRSSDNYLVNVLDKLEETGLFDNTLIVRTSDHGEMGLSHGGLRQKNFNFYEETLKVPLVFSNPKLFPRPQQSDALVSHVDLLPTLAGLVKAPESFASNCQGVDYSDVVLSPKTAPEPQDYTVFTYDDYQSGQANGPWPHAANHIVSIREKRWKLARYYEPEGKYPTEWEMYDLREDPEETVNLAAKGFKRSATQEAQFLRLKTKLAKVEEKRLKP